MSDELDVGGWIQYAQGDLSLYTIEYTRNLLNEAEEAYEWFLRQIN